MGAHIPASHKGAEQLLHLPLPLPRQPLLRLPARPPAPLPGGALPRQALLLGLAAALQALVRSALAFRPNRLDLDAALPGGNLLRTLRTLLHLDAETRPDAALLLLRALDALLRTLLRLR